MENKYKYFLVIEALLVALLIHRVDDTLKISKVYREEAVISCAKIIDFIPYETRDETEVDVRISYSYIYKGKEYQQYGDRHLIEHSNIFEKQRYFCSIGDSIPILILPSDPTLTLVDTNRVYRILRERGKSDLLKR